jgi:hypothetical protein
MLSIVFIKTQRKEVKEFMKTRADFIRDIKKGNVSVLKTLHYGKTLDQLRKENKETLTRFETHMTTYRTINKVQSNGFYINGSFLELPNAKQFEYNGSQFRVYNIGYRPLNEKEQEIYNQWLEITKTEQYKNDLTYDLLTDYHGTYYQKISFFENKGFPYLDGIKENQGKKLVTHYYENDNCIKGLFIRDTEIKGNLIFEYEIKFN